MLYVNSNEMAWIVKMEPREEKSLFGAFCAECHGATNTPRAPTLNGVEKRLTRDATVRAIRDGTGRMPGFGVVLDSAGIDGLADQLLTGKPAQGLPTKDPGFSKYRNTVFDIFLDHEGYPGVAMPWGTLNAIDLNKGTIAWTIPFGEYPKLVAQGLTNTGTDSYGGATVTQNGLLIIAATTYDDKVRAFDKTNGKSLRLSCRRLGTRRRRGTW